MDPVSMIVGALAAGATAATKEVGGQVVEDAYNALKHLIIERHNRGGAIAALEEDPSSEAQKQALKEALTKAAAGDDAIVVQAAQALHRKLQAMPEPDRQAVGAIINEIKTETLDIGTMNPPPHGVGTLIDKVQTKTTTIGVAQAPN